MSKSSRRAFLGRLGTAAVVPALGSLSSSAFSFSAPAVASAEQGAAPRASYDLLIAGGWVIDPGQNLSAVRDVAILHGRVARIAENIPHTQARSVFDATDKIVTPGLIDLHSHVYEHGTPLGVNSDRVGIEAGVTTIVDCGTAGAAMFPGFRKFVIEGARTRIYALLNISTAGCCTDTGRGPAPGVLHDQPVLLRSCGRAGAPRATADLGLTHGPNRHGAVHRRAVPTARSPPLAAVSRGAGGLPGRPERPLRPRS